MNQMKKSYKVKGVRERTTLIEFMVTKRTKFLDYLKELHTVNGAFWMNVIHLNIFDLSEHFRVSGDCLKFNYLFESSSSSCNVSCLTTSSLTLTKEDRAANEPTADFCNDTWLSRYLPSLSILCMSLSDFLSAPLAGDEFVECVYGVLLELEVAFAGGSATRAMALHNLNAFRENFSSKIARIMNIRRRENQIDVSAENKVEFKAKYIFMRKGSEAYIPTPVSYDAIISPLCTVLSFTYRKLCDYDQIHNPDIAKRVISIDKRLEKLFFARITDEIEKVAHSKLIRESLLLSTEGFFMGFAEDSLLSTLDPLKFSTASSETATNNFNESSSSNETSGEDD